MDTNIIGKSVFSIHFFKILNLYINDIFTQVMRGQRHLYITTTASYLLNICQFFFYNSNLQFKSLIDIVGVDYPKNEKRFEIIYQFLSLKYSVRLFIKIYVNEFDAVQSITSIYKGAGWFEREIFDLFGVFFNNHSDLRRILTDYGFEGFPLRKDFPLTGYLEVLYDETSKQVVSTKLELTQDFRVFSFLNPWVVFKNK